MRAVLKEKDRKREVLRDAECLHRTGRSMGAEKTARNYIRERRKNEQQGSLPRPENAGRREDSCRDKLIQRRAVDDRVMGMAVIGV